MPQTAQPPVGPVVVTASGGVELARWWRRFLGYLLDVVIVDLPTVLLLFIGASHLIRQEDGRLTFVTAGNAGEVAIVGVSTLVALAYPYLMLRFRSQTVGMMAVGVRAVDRSSGAALGNGQAATRVATFFCLGPLWIQIETVAFYMNGSSGLTVLLRLVGVAGLLFTGLWPTGSPLNQTLQDKVADTIVVRIR